MAHTLWTEANHCGVVRDRTIEQMVLPTRRPPAPGRQVMLTDNMIHEDESHRRSFPATPHFHKKRRIQEDESSTPPSGSSAGAESVNTAENQGNEAFVEVSVCLCVCMYACVCVQKTMMHMCV